MRWVGLAAVVVVVSSVALVSLGQSPKPSPVRDTPNPPVYAPAPYVPPQGQGPYDLLPPVPPTSPATAWPPTPPVGPMVVKVYAVPDLVAVTQPAGSRLPFGANPEIAAVMQQVAAQVQAQVGAINLAGGGDPNDQVAKNLERLKKALRIAAPRRSWEEGGGEGEIEIYPDTLSLIVRQTPDAHTAIAELLTQLRATQDVIIELNVEVLTIDSKNDENTKTIMALLGKELSPEEAATFRSACGECAGSTLVRVPNGQTAAMGGILSQFMARVMAVARADRSLVEFRMEFPFLDGEMAALASAGGNVHTVSVGKTLATLPLGGEGEMLMLVTPKVVDRTASKSPSTEVKP